VPHARPCRQRTASFSQDESLATSTSVLTVRGLRESRQALSIPMHFLSTSLIDQVAAFGQSSRDPCAPASAIAVRFWPTPTPTPDPDRPWPQ